MEKITSRENAKVKYACRLASSGAFRRAEEYRAAHGDLLVPVNYKTGDGFCLGAGWLRINFWRSFLLILLGKFVRYLVLSAVSLHIFS